MRDRDVHDYRFRPAPFTVDLGAPYLVTVTRSDDPSGEPVAELPYEQALAQYGNALWPPVVTCGTCHARYPAITPADRCPFEYEHPDPDDEEAPDLTGPLYKTTIVIWSRFCGDKEEISALAAQAEDGTALCTRYGSELVMRPAADKDWGPDAAVFFDDDKEDGDADD